MFEYCKCNYCNFVGESGEFRLHEVNVTDNYWERYLICPKCAGEDVEQITVAEYRKILEELEEKEDVINV